MSIRTYLPLPALAAALAGAGGTASGAPDPGGNMSAVPVRQLRFAVLLDGKPIGHHDFTLSGAPGELSVESHASFRVTVLRVPVYRYEHEDHESWHNGCLVGMEAHTHDNGHDSEVRARLSGGALEVHGPGGSASLPGCVKSYAYWDPRLLGEHRLLNAQTGEYEQVQIARLGSDRISAAGRILTAEHYSLTSAALHIDLWYSAGGEWLALESRTPQGRLLRYEIH